MRTEGWQLRLAKQAPGWWTLPVRRALLVGREEGQNVRDSP